MKSARIAQITPDWVLTYAAVVLLMGSLINLATSFAQYPNSLTLPSMREGLGFSYFEAGILVTGAAVIRIGSSLVSGTLAPRYGSRIFTGVGTTGSGLAMLLLGAAPNYFVALAAMALIGFTSGLALTPMMGVLSSWFKIRDRGLAAGLAAAGGSVAFIVVGVLAPWLIDRSPGDGWRHTWYVFGAAVLAIGILSLVFLRDRPREEAQGPGQSASPSPTSSHQEARRSAWPMEAYKNPMVWLIASLAFCSGWCTSIFNTFFGAYLTEEHTISLSIAGQLLVLMGVLSIGSGVLWGRASDRMGRGQAFLLSFLVQGMGFALFWLVPVLGAFVTSAVLMGLTLRATYTICAASAGDHVPVQFAPASFALMSLGAGLGSAISPLVAGAISDATGTLGWAFALSTFGSLVGMAGSFFLMRRSLG